MAERMAVGSAEFCGEIDMATELQHAVVIALEDGVGLLRCQFELLEVFRLVRLEGLAVLVLHQRHAEHVDAKSLARAVLVEHVGAGDVVVIVLFAGHRRISLWHHIYSAAKLGNVSDSQSRTILTRHVSRARRSTERSGVGRCRTGLAANSEPGTIPDAVHRYALTRIREAA